MMSWRRDNQENPTKHSSSRSGLVIRASDSDLALFESLQRLGDTYLHELINQIQQVTHLDSNSEVLRDKVCMMDCFYQRWLHMDQTSICSAELQLASFEMANTLTYQQRYRAALKQREDQPA